MSIAVCDVRTAIGFQLSAYSWEREFRENVILAHAER